MVAPTKQGKRKIIDWTDLFAGGGGTSTGLTQAGHKVVCAANHWPIALETHQANHPETFHFPPLNISQADPASFPRTTGLWTSPTCTKHTRAEGKVRPAPLAKGTLTPGSLAEMVAKETNPERATMWDTARFAEVHEYSVIVVENVPEVTQWRFFPWWLEVMTEAFGYHYQPLVMCATTANRYGPAVAQTRRRWYGLFTRKPLSVPDAAVTAALPAADFLDEDPGPLLTSKPRAENTMRRISNTLSRYPDADRWIIPYYSATKAGKPVSEPCGTLTTHARHALLTDVNGTLHLRMLNIAEQSRLQGFPTEYIWRGTGTEITRQIGNSVAPPVARDIARLVEATL